MLKKFSDIVSRIRAVQGEHSTVEFARRLGMTQQTVDLYLKEARKPSLEFVLKVCSTFDVSADWLLGLTDDRAPGAAVTTDARIAELEKKVIRLEGENSALQKALTIVGGHSARPVKTGGATAAKIA